MIRVTVELISAVSPSRNKVLGTAAIINDGTGTVSKGNYLVAFSGPGGGAGKSGRVEQYPRKALSVWNLVRQALQEAGYTK